MRLSKWKIEWFNGLLPYCFDRSNNLTNSKAHGLITRVIETGSTINELAVADKKDNSSYYKCVQVIVKRAALHGYNPAQGQVVGIGVDQKYSGTTTQVKSVRNPETGETELHVERLWVKSKGNELLEKEERLTAFADAFVKGYDKRLKPSKIVPKNIDSELITLYPLGDPHFGMFAWAKETGEDDFDSETAERELKAALFYLINRAPNSHTGVLVNLGDLFHADGYKPLTPGSGHVLDVDGKLGFTIDAAARAFRYAIDLMLEKHKEVKLYNVRGNHDPTMGLFFNKLMQAVYENEPRVTVVDNENKFLTIEWGKSGIWLHHGDKINAQRLYQAVTRDYAEMWGRTKHRRIWQGHLHHYKAQELGGCLHEIWQTLAASDAWHAGSGYGSGRSASCVTFHKEFGEYDRVTCGIDMVKAHIK